MEEQLLQGLNEVKDVISLRVHAGSDLVLASLLDGTLLILDLVAPLKPQSEQSETTGTITPAKLAEAASRAIEVSDTLTSRA